MTQNVCIFKPEIDFNRQNIVFVCTKEYLKKNRNFVPIREILTLLTMLIFGLLNGDLILSCSFFSKNIYISYVSKNYGLFFRFLPPEVPPFDLVPKVLTSSMILSIICAATTLSMVIIYSKKHEYEIDTNQVRKELFYAYLCT